MNRIDAHCHLNMPEFAKDLDEVIQRAQEAEVQRFLVVGFDEPSNPEAIRLAEERAALGLFASVGIHPHEASTVKQGLPASLKELASHSRVLAIGETGLDYFYDHSPRSVQKEAFVEHIDWARKVRKPLIVHIRDAYAEALDLLRIEGADLCGGVIHCFSGTWEDAVKAMDLGFYISFAGPVTYPRNEELRDVASRIPLDRILCETDSPFLSPQGYRGKRNEPAYVKWVYETLAQVRGQTMEELSEAVWINADRLFGWGK